MSATELSLREKHNAPPLTRTLTDLFRHLGAFWSHFSLHKRKCDYSGADIISVFSPSCPNPVWARSHWLQHADPPAIEYNSSRSFFEQAAELFHKCPLPHNISISNENCDYTDDCWYCKDLLLNHQSMESQNCHYCYRLYRCVDCQFCVFSFSSELCSDLINCTQCYNVHFAVNARTSRDSAFLFDCRNCSDCYRCWNLRHKKFCIENVQYDEATYQKKRAEIQLKNRSVYLREVEIFKEILFTKALWKGTESEQCEESTGSYISHLKNCENAFFISKSEDCINVFRGISDKDVLDCIGVGEAELVYYSSNCMGNCYNLRFCTNVHKSKNVEYCAFCYDCNDCFACFGLVGKQHHIFNKPYSLDAYKKEKERIISSMKNEGTYGTFFPPSMAPSPFNESISAVFFPLSTSEQQKQGFRIASPTEVKTPDIHEVDQLPESYEEIDPQKLPIVFWDPIAQRRVQITEHDYRFSKKLGTPLPYNFYTERLKSHCTLMPFGGAVRSAIGANNKNVYTALPPQFDTHTVDETIYEPK